MGATAPFTGEEMRHRSKVMLGMEAAGRKCPRLAGPCYSISQLQALFSDREALIKKKKEGARNRPQGELAGS